MTLSPEHQTLITEIVAESYHLARVEPQPIPHNGETPPPGVPSDAGDANGDESADSDERDE